MTTSTPFRLPTNVRPQHYRLTFKPNLADFTFQGEESVDIQVLAPTSTITLNASELQVSSASVTLPDGSRLPATKITLNESAETLTLSFDRTLQPGPYTLVIAFTGTLNDQLRGFYRSRYTALDGQQRFLATTQFEATDARRAFPCWDEPDIKATFEVTLVVPSDLVAVSNTPVVSQSPQKDGTKLFRFAQTPRMSTYLLALIVGDLASVEATAPGGTLVRVWATRGKEQLGRFALENAVRLLAYYNDYFGIPYPLEKLDHIAIPDFAAGAMENWGAITYRETALLYDPLNSAAYARQRIVEVVAHEMAHMWFGDLVTMRWWDDLWLNESFASWMGDKAVGHLYPQWKMWAQFYSHDTSAGLHLDGLKNSHPIAADVKDPAEIRELFDAISYSKGASILRMLEQFLGPDTFRRGLHDYLSTHQYGNAQTQDLWTALEHASGQPVTVIMDTWVKQMGFPFLQVETQRDGSEMSMTLHQSRFLYQHLLGAEEEASLWQIPVRILKAGSPNPVNVLMHDKRLSVSLGVNKGKASPKWAKVNAGQTGFYRANYSPEEWTSLKAAVKAQQIPPIDRLGLQNDCYALMRAGFLPATLFLSLAEAYRNELDPTVWGDLVGNLQALETPLSEQPFLPRFHAYARRICAAAVRRIGWDALAQEEHLDVLLRSALLDLAGSFGDRQVIKEASVRFHRYLEDPASLHPNLRSVVYGLASQGGDKATYHTLWELERKASLHEEKVRLLSALARFQQTDLLRETLERSLTPDVRSQDTVTVLTSVAVNRHGRELAWKFVQENWRELDRRYGKGGFAITRLVSTTGMFTTLQRAQEVEEFFKTHPAPSAQRTIQQSLERIRLNARWLERNRQELEEWLLPAKRAPGKPGRGRP